jgi:predicted transcriptional regulator
VSEQQKAPTDKELEILKVLWDVGEGIVRQLHAQLGADRGIVQSTVQEFLRTMAGKGLVAHRTVGRMDRMDRADRGLARGADASAKKQMEDSLKGQLQEGVAPGWVAAHKNSGK